MCRLVSSTMPPVPTRSSRTGTLVAGLLAGLSGERWRSLLLISLIGDAAIMVAAFAVGMPFDAPDTLDVGDLLVLAFPVLAIAGAARPLFRRCDSSIHR